MNNNSLNKGEKINSEYLSIMWSSQRLFNVALDYLRWELLRLSNIEWCLAKNRAILDCKKQH